MKRFVLVGSILSLVIVASNFALRTGQLEVTVRTERTSYVLGEAIQFEFEVRNTSSRTVVISNGLKPRDGYLTVWISKNGKSFEKYDHTRWGTADSARITTLKPNDVVVNEAVVFWNSRPKISDATASDIAERALEGRILTDYAFPEAGVYYLKASYTIHLTDQLEGIQVESKPITISLSEPFGDNLKVWNRIKDNGDIGYFIQEEDLPIPTYRVEERGKLRREIEQIIERYPGSIIVNQMKISLQKLQNIEEKRRALGENLKRLN